MFGTTRRVGYHDEGVVDGDADDGVDALLLELVVVLDVARQVRLRFRV